MENHFTIVYTRTTWHILESHNDIHIHFICSAIFISKYQILPVAPHNQHGQDPKGQNENTPSHQFELQKEVPCHITAIKFVRLHIMFLEVSFMWDIFYHKMYKVVSVSIHFHAAFFVLSTCKKPLHYLKMLVIELIQSPLFPQCFIVFLRNWRSALWGVSNPRM